MKQCDYIRSIYLQLISFFPRFYALGRRIHMQRRHGEQRRLDRLPLVVLVVAVVRLLQLLQHVVPLHRRLGVHFPQLRPVLLNHGPDFELQRRAPRGQQRRLPREGRQQTQKGGPQIL